MAFTFPNPADTTEFTAANGITYSWDDDNNGPGKWVVKSFLHEGAVVDLSPIPPTRPDRPDGPNDGDLWFDTSPEELTLYVYSEDSGAWIPAAPPVSLEKHATIVYSDAEDKKLQDQIDRLKEQVNILNEINKGSVALYTVKNTFGTPVSRPGEFSTNTGFYASVNTMSFGTADADGNPTKTMVNGNIIETYDAEENQANRYSITDASGAPTLVSVKYISGKLTYVINNEIEVNIY